MKASISRTCLDHQKLSWNRTHGIDVLLSFQRASIDTDEISHIGEHFRLVFVASERMHDAAKQLAIMATHNVGEIRVGIATV